MYCYDSMDKIIEIIIIHAFQCLLYMYHYDLVHNSPSRPVRVIGRRL